MTIQSFDDKAHTVVAELLDNAEARLIQTGQCTLDTVSDYLTLEYIKQAASILEYGIVYIDSDGRSAADIFLTRFAFGRVKAKFVRNSRRYAAHLQQHERYYFPNYPNLLRLAYLSHIQSDFELSRLVQSGLLMLAARSLPGVAIDIRREFRRRGLEYDRTLYVEHSKSSNENGIVTQARPKRLSR
jgi:hypothetical protein